MQFLSDAGIPCVHVHAANVMVQQPRDELHPICLISEFELALVFAPAYGDDKQLARPQLAPGAVPFSLPREVLVWGHLVYEMLTCTELTQPALLQWSERAARGEPQPGPPLLWQLLASIFLPPPTVSVGPTLAELSRTADAQEGSTLPDAPSMRVESCSPHMPPDAAEGTPTAALLSEARKHYGTHLVCTPMGGGDDFAIEFSYDDSPETTKAPAEATAAEKAAVFKAALENAAVEQAAAEDAHAEVTAADPAAAAEVVAKEAASRRASAAGWLHSMPTTKEGWVKKMESRSEERQAEAAAAVEMAARSAPPASEDQGGYYDGAYYSESGPAPERKGSAASLSLSGRRRHRRGASKKDAEAKAAEKAAEQTRLEIEKKTAEKAAAQKKREAARAKAAAAGATAAAAAARAAQSQVDKPPEGGVSKPAASPKKATAEAAADPDKVADEPTAVEFVLVGGTTLLAELSSAAAKLALTKVRLTLALTLTLIPNP